MLRLSSMTDGNAEQRSFNSTTPHPWSSSSSSSCYICKKLMTHIEFPKLMPKSPKVGSMNRQSPPIHINWDPLLINMIISLETVLLITVYTVTWRHHLMQWMNLASSTISTIPIASHTNPNPPITPPPTNYEWLITFCFFLGHELLFVSIDIYYTRF